MKLFAFSFSRLVQYTACVLVTLPLISAQQGHAQATEDHVLSSQALQQDVQSAAAAREKNIETLRDFVSSAEAERAMRDAHIDANQVRTAIPTLSDKELSDLSARATSAQQEFAAGHIGPSLLTLIILAIVAIIIIAIVA